MGIFKVWACRKRWPKMRPVISTTRVDHVSWLKAHASVGMDEEGDRLQMRIERALRTHRAKQEQSKE